ncbi:MAG: membrane protein insertase YidC [Acidobacteriota bacterium]
MERRILVVTMLAFVILFSWNSVLAKLYPPKPKPKQNGGAPRSATPTPGAVSPAGEPATDAPVAPEAATFEPIEETEAKTAVVHTDLFEATFTNKGGKLRSLRLLNYTEDIPPKGEPGRSLEAIPREMIDQGLLPLSVEVPGDDAATSELDGALFRVEPQRLELRAGESGSIRLTYRGKTGIELEKVVTFKNGSYLIGVDAALKRPGTDRLPLAVSWGPGFSNAPMNAKSEGSYGSLDYYGRAVFHANGRTTRQAKGRVKELIAVPPDASWAGLEERYFAMVFLPGAAPFSKIQYRAKSFTIDGKETQELVLEATGSGPFSLFVGPKAYDVLLATHPALPGVIEFGSWLGPLSKGMLFALKAIERATGNYGVAIIILTLVIKLGLFPLTLKSYRSMKKMSKLQPKINAIREKYKRLATDPDERQSQKMRMNEETMALYKKEGVNPVGGCLPLAVQMPFLFAFYRLLSVAIELRQAPFALWLHDLSARDPYYVTPILMTAAQFVSQRLTPVTSPDPVQQRMMTYMPLMFLFFFVKMPSGLVIYWLTSNLFQIGQQLILNRLEPSPAAGAKA